MKRVTQNRVIRIPREVHLAAKATAAAEDKTLGQLAREILEEALAQRRPKSDTITAATASQVPIQTRHNQ